MFAIGSTEILVLLVVAAFVIYFALRRLVPRGLLIILVIVLSPVVASALALFLGTLFSAIPFKPR